MARLEKVDRGREFHGSAPFRNKTFHESAAKSRYLTMLAELHDGLGLIERRATNDFGGSILK